MKKLSLQQAAALAGDEADDPTTVAGKAGIKRGAWCFRVNRWSGRTPGTVLCPLANDFYQRVTRGIAVISAASPLLQDNVGMSALAAAGVVGLLGLFNGLGRIAWLSRLRLPRSSGDLWPVLCDSGSYSLLPLTTNALLFQIVLFVILTCYGGGFATLPAFIGDIFGTRQLERSMALCHGMVSGWLAAHFYIQRYVI